MKCPQCETVISDDLKFCGECGAKLEKICPQCESSNPPHFKFCGQCGHKLTLPPEPSRNDLTLDEKLEKFQRYLPKGLTEKILSRKDRIEGEHRQVTVLFCDLQGFTPFVERLGSEQAYCIMDQIYEILIHKVHAFEGTVNEMTGDGIMALFGAPIALEDAPQRAIRSSLAIHREMARFSDKLKKENQGSDQLKMRIGIHTGPVVVGTLGNDLRVEFKAVGDTVNLASRMQDLAQPGTTYVSQDTFRLTEGLFRFEALGAKKIKGKRQAVTVYRVIAPSTRRTRFDVSAERGLTPFVGRQRELELLLDGFERAKAGRGQAFSIVSEAGVGKSRLLYEFRKAVANEDVTFLEGRCLSYSRGVSYHPIIDILRANFGIEPADEGPAIRHKVQKALQRVAVDEAATLPYLLELLAVKDSGIDQIPMSPEARKERLLEALKKIVLKGSEIRPLIMAIEDLHWIDKSSEDAVKYLLESIPAARMLLIFSYRPQFGPTWAGKSYHSQLNLNRLSNRESLVMVSHLLDSEDIDADLQTLILEKTEGIAFFIEEFIRSLQDLKIIAKQGSRYRLAKDVRTLAIPSTIQEVIMARVDSLPEGAKEVLQAGSVIEREFSHELIKRVTELPEKELLAYLSALKDLELIYERGIYPQTTYIFKHALTRQVVYDCILSKKKKSLHQKIATAIEELNQDHIEAYYGILAEHYIGGENYEKGAQYSRLSAKIAQKAAAFNGAIEYAKKRVLCLEKLPRTAVNQKKIIDARSTLAAFYMNLNYHVEASEIVVPILNQALELNYQKRLPLIYTSIGSCCVFLEHEAPKGYEYLRQAIEISERTGDHLSLFMANYYLGGGLAMNCEFEKSCRYFEKSLALSKMAHNPIGIAIVQSTMSALNYSFCGQIDLAYTLSKKSLDAVKESGAHNKALAYSTCGSCAYFKGFLDEAEEKLLQAIAFCQEAHFFTWWAWATSILANIYFDMGDYEKAETYYDK